MIHKRSRRKSDLFPILLTVVAIGVSATIAYQISIYYGGTPVPIASQAPANRSG
jgi:hypothetical protein